TRIGPARKFSWSLSSFAVAEIVAAYVVLDLIGSCVTRSTSPPRLLTDHSSPRPPGFGERPKAVANEARSNRSVHTNQRSRVVLCPDAPSAGKLTRSAGGVESIVKTAALVSEAAFPAESVAVMRTRTREESALGSVHAYDPPPMVTTRGPAITPEKPSAPPSSEKERSIVRVGSSGSDVTHRIVCMLPPVQSSPPSGARRATVGLQIVENAQEIGEGDSSGFPGSESSRRAARVTVYVVHGSSAVGEAVRASRVEL